MGNIQGRIIMDKEYEERRGQKWLRKEQAAYKSWSWTADQGFILRNIKEQQNECLATLYLNFIDFEKAFDENEVAHFLLEYGTPEKIEWIVKLFYEDFQCSVEDKRETWQCFKVKTCVKQSCNMSGISLLIVMD